MYRLIVQGICCKRWLGIWFKHYNLAQPISSFSRMGNTNYGKNSYLRIEQCISYEEKYKSTIGLNICSRNIYKRTGMVFALVAIFGAAKGACHSHNHTI
jgi:hypothetical protein